MCGDLTKILRVTGVHCRKPAAKVSVPGQSAYFAVPGSFEVEVEERVCAQFLSLFVFSQHINIYA